MYEEIKAVKAELENEVCTYETMYYLKALLHKNWSKGVAYATVLFSGYYDKDCGFLMPKTATCIRNYRRVEKALRKGTPLHQNIEKNGEIVEATFTPNGVKFGQKRKVYRIMSQTITIFPETEENEEYWDEDPYKPINIGCPKFFAHKKTAVLKFTTVLIINFCINFLISFC